MRLPQFFIDRPIFAGVISIIIVLVGILGYRYLPVSEYPEVAPPQIQIQAQYPGADPETIASTVAGPIEQQMAGLDGLIYMLSASTPDGKMQLSLTFAIGSDLQKAMVDVLNRIQEATPRLPDEVRRLGVVAKRSGQFLLVVHLASEEGAHFDTLTLANYAKLNVTNRLLGLPGVGDLAVFGAGDYAMRIWLDPSKMSALGLVPADVGSAIQAQNLQIAAGSVGQPPVAGAPPIEIAIHTLGRLSTPEQFGEIIVRRGSLGQLVRLKDIARIELGGSTYSLRSLLNNKEAAAIPIFQAPGSNAIETSDAIRAAMEDMKEHNFPKGMTYHIVYDPTGFVRDMIKEVEKTLGIAICLVVVVVIVFLQTWRASIIPLIAVPVSLIGTFAVMLAIGFSINSLSLFGLVLAIGIVVDDAIVVVENVERNIAGGLSPRAATRQAMREVSGPILATALVLCSVFIPTAFISGLTGRFYQQFALTIAISTAISAFNSLTLSPALAALLLRPHREGRRPGGWLLGWFFGGFNRGFGAVRSSYVRAEGWVVRGRWLALLVYFALLGATAWRVEATATGFIPNQDKGFLITYIHLPDGSSLDRTERVTRAMTDIALKTPGVDQVVAFPGIAPNFASTSNTCLGFICLKSFEDRRKVGVTAAGINGQLAMAFAGIPDALVFVFPPPPVLEIGLTGGFKCYLEDRGGTGQAALFQQAQQLLGKMRQNPVFNPHAVRTETSMGMPRVEVDIDRTKLEAQSIALADVYDALQGYFGSVYINDFNFYNHTWEVMLQADAGHRMTPEDITCLQVRNSAGRMVPLSSFVRLSNSTGPNIASDYNTYPAVDIQGAAAPGYSDDQGRAAMETLFAGLPRGYRAEWTELTYQQLLAGDTGKYIFPICVLLVVLVLAAFYESLTLPLAIILIVPMCILCALIGVWIKSLSDASFNNNIMTQIGLIVLVGLACKNAILIVEFAKDAEIHNGKKPFDAALEACRLRLRPILMTSIAFIAGVYPLVVAFGAGSELRQQTGVAVFAGMIGVTIFGLLLTPVFYVVLRGLTGNKPLKSHEHDDDPSAAHPTLPPH